MNDNFLRVIASLHRDGVNLDLKTVDICFLVALHARADQSGLTCFEEDVLLDVFEQVCDAVEADADNVAKRATHAIQRLRDQRLLARVDGAGVVRAGEYALTQLALGIIRFFQADEALTRESLTLLTKTLLASLAEAKANAKQATSPEQWREGVIGPLRVTVGDLVGGIERRQRGLDLQQEQVQKRIGELLQEDWFGAIDQCQSLLDETASTLAELNTVLLSDTNQIQAILSDIEQLAAMADMSDAEQTVHRVGEQVDRVAAWGGARQRAWSDFYQYVHRFLRDVVRLDPDRAISERLRNRLADWPSQPFALVIARTPSIRLLRESTDRVERPPVWQPSRDREQQIEDVIPESDLVTLEDRVRQSLAEDPERLADVLEEVLPHVAAVHRYVSVGRVTWQVAKEARPQSPRERDWKPILNDIEIEDWQLRNGRPHRSSGQPEGQA
ncbi:MAG: condensin subunit MukF [Phycisphaera sp.]|nr:condensin subunit MukF [Phycisphaera sp.]